MNLQDQVALVTGASRGIGQAIALAPLSALSPVYFIWASSLIAAVDSLQLWLPKCVNVDTIEMEPPPET